MKTEFIKIVFLTLFILIFLLIPINAQNPVSIKAGFTYSTFYDEKNNAWMLGYSISINKYWELADRFAIGSEINFVQKGGIIKDIFTAPYYPDMPERLSLFDINALVHFIQIPLLIKYNFLNNWNLKFDIFTGYFIALKIADRSGLDFGGNYLQYDPDNLEDNINYFEYYSNEYWSPIGSGLNKLNNGIELGILANYNNYYLEFKYTRDLQIFGEIEAISSINKRTHFISILFGIKLE